MVGGLKNQAERGRKDTSLYGDVGPGSAVAYEYNNRKRIVNPVCFSGLIVRGA